MIIDQETNILYVADTLPVKQSGFSSAFFDALSYANISVKLIPFTKDIWAVDYMPIQVSESKWVQFTYNPDYLQGSKKWRDSISDVDAICKEMGLIAEKSKIVLDGGNVIRWKDKVIMCNKVFKENPAYREKQLINELEDLLEVDNLIFVPRDPNDEIGHADGMVRFLDADTVLINDYAKVDKEFQLSFKASLIDAGLDYEVITYNPYQNKTYWQANGAYINYLQMQQAILIPVFGMNEDETAIKKFERFFPDTKIVPVYSNEIANDGGVLNCVSWNILK